MKSELASLRFVEGVSAGIAFTSLMGVSFIFLTATSNDHLAEFSNLFLGLVAVFSAYATVRAIRVQVFQSESHEQERKERRARAKRATLPMVLSDLYKLGWNAAAAIWSLNRDRESEWRTLVNRVYDLEEMIECFEKHDAGELTKVISNLQVLFASNDMLLDGRTLASIDPTSDAVEVGDITVFRTDRVLQWIEFMALIESGFSFARGEKDQLKLNDDATSDRLLDILRFRVDVRAEQNPLWRPLLQRIEALYGQ
ncbi:MAG: hypothetical protein O9289_14600 [Rhodobacteraceae bacterium]|jgi:hypothetical protein|nr:hypothetical protein [Paracoccaceae bacterium]MCZ8084425.1 hypothetical protein [Paracoccaceae bacterium]